MKIILSIVCFLSALTLSAQNKGPVETGLKEPVVLRTNDVVFRQIDKHTWYGTGHLFANETVYVVEGSKKAMLIDCGTEMHNLDQLVKRLTKKPVSLYITHAHPDHAGMAINYFKEVYMNPADTVGAAEYFPNYKGEMCFLKDHQVIDLGGRKIEVIFTPAHTPGSTTYVDLTNHYGFSGDSFGNGNLLLLGTFPTLKATAEKMSAFMKEHKITKLWNGHYFGSNTESPKRVADEITISEDVLSGKLTPKNKTWLNYDHLGLYNMVDTLGVKICFNKDSYYTPEQRQQGIQAAYDFLKDCHNVYIATTDGNALAITNNNAFNAYETDLYLMANSDSKLAQDVDKDQDACIRAEKDGKTLNMICKLVVDHRATSKAALLRVRPDLQDKYAPEDKNTVIYKIKQVTANLGDEELKF